MVDPLTALRRTALGAAAGFVLATGAAVAAPVSFGDRTLDIPAPAGYVAVATRAPQYISVSQSFLPTGNRLVELFTTPDDGDRLAKREPAVLARYYQLQVLRRFEGTVLSAEDFKDARDQMEASFEQAFGKLDDAARDLAASGSAELRRASGTDAQVTMGGTQFLGAFRREPWGLFFSMRSNVSIEDSGRTAALPVTASGAITLVNHQLMYFYAYSDGHGADALDWTQQALGQWVDAVRAANPDDPALEATATRTGGGFSWQRVVLFAILGAITAALYGRARNRRA